MNALSLVAVRAAFNTLISVDVPAAAADLDAVLGGQEGAPQPDLSVFLHTRGINMRYLPHVAACCCNATARQFLEQEVIVRTAKHTLRALWAQRAVSETHAAAIADNIIHRLRRGDRELWAQLSLPGAPAWAWETRLRAAVGLEDALVSAKHEHRLRMVLLEDHSCNEVRAARALVRDGQRRRVLMKAMARCQCGTDVPEGEMARCDDCDFDLCQDCAKDASRVRARCKQTHRARCRF